MATLVDNKDEIWQQREDEDWRSYYDRMDEELQRLTDEGVIVKFPYADGFAFYQIVSEKPLKLKHIPCGDAWELDYSHIRGLRLPDIKARLKQEQALKKLFS